VPKAIWLVIELDRDISPTNTFVKFGGNWMRNVQVRERTKLKLPILTNSGAITLEFLERFGWLSNLTEIFHQQTL